MNAAPSSSLSAQEDLAALDLELQRTEAQIEALLQRQADLQDRREHLSRIVNIDSRAPRADWTAASFPWESQVEALLRSVFGLQSWRPLQREVVNATLQGRDLFCLMPAGGGKSLCYQLPALVSPGGSVTLVVSPLLALINDQFIHMRRLNIATSALTSLSSKEELNAVLKSLDDATEAPRLLYVTPERVASSKRLMSKLDKLYKANRLARIAVDESHCASQWGNDFRPDYRKLGILRQQFPDVPIMALTATATASVVQDVTEILKIQGCEVLRNSVDRPNLYYEVKQKPNGDAALAEDIATWIQSNFSAGEAGLVYCLTKKDCEALTTELMQRGIAAACYHADIEAQDRLEVHDSWTRGVLQVICCTVAFGMGVNHTAVRFVIHHTMSNSVENYYQESGRAGRDGKLAHCRLYYRFADALRQASVVAMEASWEPHLKGMLAYASATTCRRASICRHFAEEPSRCAAMCDTCRQRQRNSNNCDASGSRPSCAAIDATEAAGAAIAILQAWPGTEQRATMTQLLAKWPKSGGPLGCAAAKALGKDGCERVLQTMVAMDALRFTFGFTAYTTNVYLKCGPKAAAVADGRLKVMLAPLVGGQQPNADVAIKPDGSETQDRENRIIAGTLEGIDNSRARQMHRNHESENGMQQANEVEPLMKRRRQEGDAPQQGKIAEKVSEVVNLADSDDDDFV